MSRGPGVAQRRIMQEVETKRYFYLAWLTDGTDDAEYKSLYRAACRLNDMDRIGMLICRYGSPKVIVYHPDFDIGNADLIQLRRDLEKQHAAPTDAPAADLPNSIRSK